jgi:hypothetical protein
MLTTQIEMENVDALIQYKHHKIALPDYLLSLAQIAYSCFCLSSLGASGLTQVDS